LINFGSNQAKGYKVDHQDDNLFFLLPIWNLARAEPGFYDRKNQFPEGDTLFLPPTVNSIIDMGMLMVQRPLGHVLFPGGLMN